MVSSYELEVTAEELYRLSDNARCVTTPHGYKFVLIEGKDWAVAENNEDCQVSRVTPMGQWLGELAQLDGRGVIEWEIAYLTEAILEVRRQRIGDYLG